MTASNLRPFRLETVAFEPTPGGGIKVTGSITLPDPVRQIQPYLTTVHDAAMASGVAELVVDLKGLTFVNSSAIRLFLDWVTWVLDSKGAYRLVFVGDRGLTWQRSALNVFKSMGGSSVDVRF